MLVDVEIMNNFLGEGLIFDWVVNFDLDWIFLDSINVNLVSFVIQFLEGGEYEFILSVSNFCIMV